VKIDIEGDYLTLSAERAGFKKARNQLTRKPSVRAAFAYYGGRKLLQIYYSLPKLLTFA
jgi:hypothetical protein